VLPDSYLVYQRGSTQVKVLEHKTVFVYGAITLFGETGAPLARKLSRLVGLSRTVLLTMS